MSEYFDGLAARLAERGVDGERARAILDDLAAYVRESGADPEAEFGPAGEFAAELTGAGDAGGGAEEADPDVLRWTADVFEGPRSLNAFGEQGWEVDRVDRVGRFVARRDREHPQTWEYLQEVAASRADRERLAARLAPDGWEPCGHWSVLAYFKRPGSATAGPAAELEAPPPPSRRRYFIGVKGAVFSAVCLVVAVVAAAWSLPRLVAGPAEAQDSSELLGFVLGAAAGLALPLAAFWLAVRLWSRSRERRRSGG
ncbi:DUF2812 domain-containing protein [Nocardiopsis composta]|uniref:DUF2812 domain-containing protein n=1 Tax=Nocardiopsis composta TaxID=157465 RepID=A0A7W8QMP1_9ACTN|nr:DUF2812 domain-containing protein [Nocardiopsis composta]MBB5432809.1 hypothetical protein [Nocardiopsis composta]